MLAHSDRPGRPVGVRRRQTPFIPHGKGAVAYGERLGDQAVDQIGQRSAGCLGHDLAQHVHRHRIAPARPWRAGQRHRCDAREIFGHGEPWLVEPVGHAGPLVGVADGLGKAISQARRVRQQLPHGYNRLSSTRQFRSEFGDEPGHRIVKRDAAGLDQRHRRGGDNRLGDGG